MKNGAKIHLSTQEMELLTNKEWLFLKRSILDKIAGFLGGMHNRYSEVIVKENIDLNFLTKNHGGKISKGENYKGLPYMILDYPAQFSRDHIFAVRTLFWWGNFFSISLHVSGNFRPFSLNVKECFSYLKSKEFLINSGTDEWDHDLSESGYLPVSKVEYDQFLEILKNDFFKISKKVYLNELDKAPELLEEGFREIMEFSKISCRQAGGKGL